MITEDLVSDRQLVAYTHIIKSQAEVHYRTPGCDEAAATCVKHIRSIAEAFMQDIITTKVGLCAHPGLATSVSEAVCLLRCTCAIGGTARAPTTDNRKVIMGCRLPRPLSHSQVWLEAGLDMPLTAVSVFHGVLLAVQGIPTAAGYD